MCWNISPAGAARLPCCCGVVGSVRCQVAALAARPLIVPRDVLELMIEMHHRQHDGRAPPDVEPIPARVPHRDASPLDFVLQATIAPQHSNGRSDP